MRLLEFNSAPILIVFSLLHSQITMEAGITIIFSTTNFITEFYFSSLHILSPNAKVKELIARSIFAKVIVKHLLWTTV